MVSFKTRLLVVSFTTMLMITSLRPFRALAEPPPATLDNLHGATEQAAQRQALGFLGYLDQGRFADSYAYTGLLMRSQLDPQTYTSKIANMRTGVGPLQGRELIDAVPASIVPGAPEGQYIVLHYHANYQNLSDAVDTVTLAFAKGYWRVIGYYVK
jgi:hypothetical protein